MKNLHQTTMQVEISGNWVYIFSGREYLENNPDMTQVGFKDPFRIVQCIKLEDIAGIKADHIFENQTIEIFVRGHMFPIRLEFGRRNCYRINCFGAALCKLIDALGISREFVWNREWRNEQTALSVQRADEQMEVE